MRFWAQTSRGQKLLLSLGYYTEEFTTQFMETFVASHYKDI